MQQGLTKTRSGGSKTGGAPDRVYRQLRERILNFDLPPGASLSRNEIAEKYGVSQAPVREALQALEEDGLVLIIPQSRTLVSQIDVKQLYENQFLRVALECEVVRRLADARQTETIDRARTILRMQSTLEGQINKMDLFNELDRSFHAALFEGAGMSRINEMVRRKMGHLARCQRLELPVEGKMKTILQQHARVIEELEAGDAQGAAAAMNEHLSGTISRVEKLREEFPDYFTDGKYP
ncbi:GntR family transcriptional regulator [uncultured Roseibium sp.]|uniref:GntR family transcriptional regulator n=1 Tax=uncultured Roseibium sp. TaxID=1936171 RepID=UPI002629209C|nr:GntR family transcriptional regulator [uncultured Roseibium sp.]